MSHSFAVRLKQLFETVEPQFREERRAYYLAQARGEFAAWMARLDGPEPEKGPYHFYQTRPPRYVSHYGGCYTPIWESLQKAKAEGHWFCDEARAIKDADFEVDEAKRHFVIKHAKKLNHATNLRTDVPHEISGVLRYGSRIEGALKVRYSNGDSFELTLSMITNYRKGRAYWQFPSRFVRLVYGGQGVNAKPSPAILSERWLAENFR